MIKKMMLGFIFILVISSMLGCGAAQATVPNSTVPTEKAAISTPAQVATDAPTVVSTVARTETSAEPTAVVDPTTEPTSETPATVAALSAAEEADLLFMREEEKLARDVYQAFDDLWGVRIFGNIAQSEQKHMDAILTLLEQFGIADPVVDSTAGVFANADLQALYDTLIAQGSVSSEEALKVGAAIEEIDILDLEEAMANTSNADILRVYTSLTLGSYNHLRSFTGNLLRQTGEVYTPQYMTQEAYDVVLSAG
ncbi:MAG: DUF2202 domain-containing protein [Anaerolineae bacterium]